MDPQNGLLRLPPKHMAVVPCRRDVSAWPSVAWPALLDASLAACGSRQQEWDNTHGENGEGSVKNKSIWNHESCTQLENIVCAGSSKNPNNGYLIDSY